MSVAYDLHCITYGNDTQTNFTTQLLRLIFKADCFNREKLRLAFPYEVEMVESYQKTGKIKGMQPND
jgi:hypothetical protein